MDWVVDSLFRTLPYIDRRSVNPPKARPVPKGPNRIIHGLLLPFERYFRYHGLLRRGKRIYEQSIGLKDLPFEEIRTRLFNLRDGDLKRGRWVRHEGVIDEALSILSEVSFRSLGIRPYREQIACVLVLINGGMAEMATGEGKSLVAAICAAFWALTGRPVHVVTSNDYLAERDAGHFKGFFDAISVEATYVVSATPQNERPSLYAHDIVYTTGKELLGDFLRDRLNLGSQTLDVQRAVELALNISSQKMPLNLRGLHAVIVDEADSVLIDDGVMPLLLSMPAENAYLTKATAMARDLIAEFREGEHYRVLRHVRRIIWTDRGERHIAGMLHRFPRFWQGFDRCKELMTLALMAKELFFEGEHYIIRDGKVVLIDVQTGRLAPNRHFGIGLHQAIEAKEGLDISAPSETVARYSYQCFFRLIPVLSGMSGTLKEAEHELWHIYETPVVRVPTHRKVIRKELPWLFFRTAQDKYSYIATLVKALYEKGQPVLIGTRTVESSEAIAELFKKEDIPVSILNAVRHREEAEIISGAGNKKSVMIATNMAGRGTDIALTDDARGLGGLFVIVAEPQLSARLDRQLSGRSGRQGDPGASITLVSMEDALVKAMLPRWVRGLFTWTLPFHRGRRSVIGTCLVRFSQWRAERLSARQRLSILEQDNWIDEQLSFPV